MEDEQKTELEADLEFLAERAFSFHLEVNPHAPFHETIAGELSEDRVDDWTSPEARAQAYATGRYIEGTVYPCGGVSSYLLRGTSVAEVVARCAAECRADQERWNRNNPGEYYTQSPAFDACPLPATADE